MTLNGNKKNQTLFLVNLDLSEDTLKRKEGLEQAGKVALIHTKNVF